MSTYKRIRPTQTDVNDLVHNPNHYQSSSGLDVKTVIKAFTEHLVGYQAVYTANVIKYICRWKKKDGVRDLYKAKEYIEYLIKEEENEEKENDCHE